MIIITKLPQEFSLRSPWVYHINTGSCDLCDKEIPPCFCDQFNLQKVGILLKGSPKNASILLITGPIAADTVEQVRQVYEQMPSPKAVVALGTCAANERVYDASPALAGAPGAIVPIDIYIPGCPPKPQTIAQGIKAAGRFLMEGRKRCVKGKFGEARG